MRVALSPAYPFDQYLVESNRKYDMISIIDDDLWKQEAALKPEDEIMLNKLHDMLQSTAEDLRVLTGELVKYHEPGILIKSQPMPLDEEFNRKIHIEEIVSAKFHGHKIIDQSKKEMVEDQINVPFVKKDKPVANVNFKPCIKSLPKKSVTNLSKSKTRTYKISDSSNVCTESKKIEPKCTVSYNEFKFTHDPIIELSNKVVMKVQHMPSINIRSELKEQKVLQLDIVPEANVIINTENKNIAIIETKHEVLQPARKAIETRTYQPMNYRDTRTVRKVSKMSTCESSESTNNASSDTQKKADTHHKVKLKLSPKHSKKIPSKSVVTKKGTKEHFGLDEWKRKLDKVYGYPSSSRKNKNKSYVNENKSNPKHKHKNVNNTDYIPYSQLTLGGVRLSDIERELSDGPLKEDIPLSPILDKILSSKESSPRKNKEPKALNTSDEALLQEVIDIEKKVTKTLSKGSIESTEKKDSNSGIKSDSYDDDFEDIDKSDDNNSIENQSSRSGSGNDEKKQDDEKTKKYETLNRKRNLSFKNSVDIFEFVHSVDMQDNGTQSNATGPISLKETQTSPRNESANVSSIRNDIWSSLDPKGEVKNLFKSEKEFIKKIIIGEYGDVIESCISKPKSNEKFDKDKNMKLSQKDTQTSPAHVKSVMTSPTRTKTRTTSPFTLNLPIDHHTSPLSAPHREEKSVQLDSEDIDKELITINLSSPKFSLKLPQTIREVLSNLEQCTNRTSINSAAEKPIPEQKPHSSTSVEADVSSSDISSLGEINVKLKRRLRKYLTSCSSESSVTSKSSITSLSSLDFNLGSILPLRSDGEVSELLGLRKTNRKKNDNNSLGQL